MSQKSVLFNFLQLQQFCKQVVCIIRNTCLRVQVIINDHRARINIINKNVAEIFAHLLIQRNIRETCIMKKISN